MEEVCYDSVLFQRVKQGNQTQVMNEVDTGASCSFCGEGGGGGWGGRGLQERVEESGKLGGEETAARMGFLFPF